ncbi:Long-chain-fatty-acid--CoA ligase 5 [Clonorchis sinensis]|uniref:long-chain-fatty-acid--CoA ligase n=1 Tax=Clonorchis sinensis TaxID=79923 RepID=A0A8T1M2V1_CLOSI|nr:Long-chain-fatty-acid--CoA ligase 5 [Clonorchis sinensis]
MNPPQVQRLEPLPYIHCQSKITNKTKHIRSAPVELKNSELDNMRIVGDLVKYCAEKYKDIPCFGRRPNFYCEPNWRTYEQVGREILALGAALSSLVDLENSVNRYVGIYGRNSPEWVCSQYACAHYGLVVVPLYDTFGEEALKHIINQTKIRIVICDTMIRVHALLTWAGEDLKDIIVIEASRDALHKMNDQPNNMPKLHTYEEMLVHGSKLPPEQKKANPDDLFLVCYTSGATGFPKGVMHTHRSFLRATTMSTAVLAITGLPEHGNLHISYLPLSHIMEQVIMSVCLLKGTQIAFLTKDLTGLRKDLCYYRPTFFFAVPRILNRVYKEALQNMELNWFTRRLYNFAVKRKCAEQKRGIFRRAGFLDRCFFRELRGQFGGRIQFVASGSAPLQFEVLQFVKAAFSCPVMEFFGSTEAGGLVTMTLPTDITGSHVGSVAPGVQVKLIDVPDMNMNAERDGFGEVCAKSDACTVGYFEDEDNTRGLLDEEGFIRLGDIGCWTENGALKIVDRCKNVFKLAQGEYVSPEKVEQIYVLSPLVINIFVDGQAMYNFAVGVVVPDFKHLRSQYLTQLTELFGASRVAQLDIVEVCKHKGVAKLILEELVTVGKKKGLKGFEQIHAVYLHPEPFTITNGLLTPTMKISRPHARKRFAPQIEALYEETAD